MNCIMAFYSRNLEHSNIPCLLGKKKQKENQLHTFYNSPDNYLLAIGELVRTFTSQVGYRI